MSEDFICSICLTNASQKRHVVNNGMLQCNGCFLNLPLSDYRPKHKKCKSCQSVQHLEWQRNNASLWQKGGKYYKYIKKKTKIQESDFTDQEQINSLNNNEVNYII